MEDKKLSRKERRALEFGHSSPCRWRYDKAPIDISYFSDIELSREESMLNARDLKMRLRLDMYLDKVPPEDCAKVLNNPGLHHNDQLWTFTH